MREFVFTWLVTWLGVSLVTMRLLVPCWEEVIK